MYVYNSVLKRKQLKSFFVWGKAPNITEYLLKAKELSTKPHSKRVLENKLGKKIP